MMRLAIYLPSLRGGGAERVMVTLANGFAARGFAVDLVLAKAEGPYLPDVSQDVRVVDLRARRVLTSLPALVRYLRRERPQAMLSALNHANVVAVWARRLASADTRLVVSERSTLSASRIDTRLRRSRLVPWLMRLSYPKADHVVAVSSGVADDLSAAIGLPRERISVVYNPIEIDKVRALSQAPLEHPWFADGQPPVLLAVGRLTKAKDYPTLLHAFALLRKQRAARLVILGEGELRGELEALIEKLGIASDVSLPGFDSNPYSYMSRASLFVLSSRFEGLPNALIQAMACGTPIVSTDCPSGPAEILEGGKWGQLIAVGDAKGLAQAMLQVLVEQTHPDVLKRAQEFNLTQAIDGYLCVLLSAKEEG